jgi:hypothetical protein
MRVRLLIGIGGESGIGNWFAYLALFGWPAICIALFVLLPLEAAAIAAMLGGYLLLPSNLTVDVPLLPPLDKMSIAAIATFLLCWMKGAESPGGRAPVMLYVFAFSLVLSPILTSLTNSYELTTPRGSIPGFYPVDGLKIAGRQLIALLPLFVGIRFLSNDYGRSLLLKSLPVAMTVYSIPMLFELRMSPQLHRLVYGYHPSDFFQQMRAGGFRPVVFVEHGLVLALLTSLAVIASVVLVRAKKRVFNLPAGFIAGYLSVLLLLCKSLGPTIYAAVLTPVVMFAKPRTWAKIACLFALILCSYPVLRASSLIPVHHIADLASAVSIDRSESFETRVVNEDVLLARANEKPLFGWGTWGRNRVFDRETGKDVSITDGQWVIQIGIYGWFGYFALFGLLAVAIFGAYRQLGNQVTPTSISLGGLALILGVHVIDMIPNATAMSLTLLLAGTIAARTAPVITRVPRTSPTPTQPSGVVAAP